MAKRREKHHKQTSAAMASMPASASAAPGVPLNKYDAAGYGRRLRGWNPPASGPNRAIDGLDTIRNRARDALRNEWSGTSGARVWTSNLIGTGIIPRPRTSDPGQKRRLTDLWDAWVPQADADGVNNFYGLQTLATRNWIASGEVFARLRPRRLEDGLAVPLQVQLLESDMVPLLDTDIAPGMPAGNRIRSGIELNRVGRRVAYWMYREHPGDRYSHAASLTDLVRVPADGVVHLYEPQRPGQMRGVSDFAPILVKLRGVMDFDDAVLERQKLANLFTLFITRANQGTDPNIDPITGLPITGLDHDGAPLAALEPGLSQELLPGEDVKFSEPPDAGANYGDFMRQQHLGVAAGQGTPYELLTGDLRDISDRTLRVIINEFHRHCEQRQWQIIIPRFCQTVREAWADAAALSGALSMADAAEARRVTWQPQGWAYLHPVQDVQGKNLEVESGFRSRASVIAERGDDPDEVDAERAADDDRARDLGLLNPKKVKAMARAMTDLAASAPRVEHKPDPEQSPEVLAARAMADGQVRAAEINRAAQAEAKPAEFHFHQGDTYLQPPNVSVENKVEPTPITVNNQVEPTPIKFDAIMPEQPAPVVHVDVQPADVALSLPRRRTRTEIERDVAGNIVRTTQIETDDDEGGTP